MRSMVGRKMGQFPATLDTPRGVIRTGLSDLRLAFGDSLLLQGPREKLALLRLDKDKLLQSVPGAQVIGQVIRQPVDTRVVIR